MEITDVEVSSSATSPSLAQRQEPRKSCMPPSFPSSRKRKSATKTTNDPKEKPPKEVMQRSWVWNHVSKCTIKEVKEVMKEGKMQKMEVEVLKAKCNYCGQLFACDPSASGTSTYSKHIRQVCKKYVRNDEIHQKVLGSSTSSISASGEMSALFLSKGWSQDESVAGIVEFIVIDKMPFGVVEKEGFRRMMNKVQPRLHVPSRRTIVREIFKMYDHLYADLRVELGKHRVSLTTDTWTSIQNVNYMVLTAHFVDNEWNMQKRIINFCPIASHSANQIGKLIEQCLVEWKIEKVMCISVDNASANKVAIEWFVGKMLKWPNCQLLLEGKYMHVRCLAHILNLIVKDGLKKLDKSVTSIRNAVRFVRSSPKRFDYFKKCVEIEKLDNKDLVVMDVPTRWNSTYLMLESALKFRKAFDRMYEDENNGYLSYFQGKEDIGLEYFDVVEGEVDKSRKGKVVGPPTKLDWESAQVFVSFFKVFYLVTLKLSASKHPTSHTAVHDMIVVECEILKIPSHALVYVLMYSLWTSGN